MIKRIAEYALAIVLVVILISLVFGYVLGQPALVAYVETGSMEPTLNAGDGFIAVPAAIAGDVQTGDVVAFESEHVHGGQLTTHRVVDVREDGYITQGDANPFTDQSQAEPPVTDGQIKAVALQVNGEVVRIPHLGTAAMALQTGFGAAERTVAGLFGLRTLGAERMAYILFAGGLGLFMASFLFGGPGRRDRDTDRGRWRSREGVFSTTTIIVAFVIVLLIVTTIAMVMPAGTATYSIVSSQSDSDRPDVIQMGGSSEITYPMHNGGFLPVISYLEPASTGVEVEPQRFEMGMNGTANATVTMHAPDETGLYQRSVTEYRYIVVLPPSVIDALYVVHPWLPYIAINTVVGSLLLILGFALSRGSGQVRLRSRKRERRSGILGWLS